MVVESRDVLNRPAPAPDHTVRYGPDPDQIADVRGTAPADLPMVVILHGGFWRPEWDRTHTGPLAAALAEIGYPVAQLEYRRGAGWPAMAEDVVTGIATLAGRYGPPLLLGHSAGGQLALWYATTPQPQARGVVALAPVADLAEAYRLDLDGGAVAALFGGAPDEKADPCRRVPIMLPSVIVHGDADRYVPIDLSRRLAALDHAAGGASSLVELPQVGHFALIDPETATWSEVTTALRSLH